MTPSLSPDPRRRARDPRHARSGARRDVPTCRPQAPAHRTRACARDRCGVGLLAPHVARRCAEYLGIDFAGEVLAVACERLARNPSASRCRFAVVDVLDGLDGELTSLLGRFVRVLLYAVLQYSRTEADGCRFVSVALRCLRPGGFALFGNLPLEDLRDDVCRSWLVGSGRAARTLRLARWIHLGASRSAGRSAGKPRLPRCSSGSEPPHAIRTRVAGRRRLE